MAEKITVGVFTPNDPRRWIRCENLDLMLDHERSLIEALLKEGVEVIRGGEGFPKEDQIAWNSDLVRKHIKKIAESKPDALIVNQGSWTFPFDSIDAVKFFQKETEDIARVVMFSYKDTKVPGLVGGMAAGGGLKRIGVPFQPCYGRIDEDPKVLGWLMEILRFYKRRADVAGKVLEAIEALKNQKFLALGGMSLRMPTTTADVDQWQKLLGISYEALDQSEMKLRALNMVKWSGKPGESDYEIVDPRVKDALEFLYEDGHGRFDFSRDKLRSINKFLYQLTLYYAAIDLFKEYGATFGGIKCQDELSARDCTACIATSYLGNDVGPDGKLKPIYPLACENDMDSALTQLWLHLLSGQPAGFGDFRDVENGVLTISNCGQHPPYFFGRPDENSLRKLNLVEYVGQETYYPAGGSSVRGRTPGGEVMTVARLGRENLRYQLVATVIETLDVPADEHEKYTYSWPIIKGKIPMKDEVLIDVWPCNHLGFTYGDFTPHLVEMAHRLNIGYRVFDANGREHYKTT